VDERKWTLCVIIERSKFLAKFDVRRSVYVDLILHWGLWGVHIKHSFEKPMKYIKN
jgi:hypothetical protein